MGGVTPQGLDATVATAIPPVEVIAHGILCVIILMVVLGRIKRTRIKDRRGDALAERLLRRRFRGFRNAPLLLTADVNGRRIGFTPVAELPACIGWVDRVPEGGHQIAEGHFARIVGDLNHFAMAGAAGCNLPVGRILDMPAAVARDGGDDAGDLVEVGFNAPEAAAGENDGFSLRLLGDGAGCG